MISGLPFASAASHQQRDGVGAAVVAQEPRPPQFARSLRVQLVPILSEYPAEG